MCDTHVLEKQTVQLLLAVLHTHAIARIDDPHKCIGLLKIIPPVGPERSLTANIPW